MDYNIFKICRNLKGENRNIYKQRTNTGIDCCLYPSVENLYIINEYNNSQIESNKIILNDIDGVENYLKIYQLLNTTNYNVNKGCKYFKDESDYPNLFEYTSDNKINKDTIPSELLSTVWYSDKKIKDNFNDLYEFVSFQVNILRGIIGENNILEVPSYTKTTVSCNTNGYVPRYIKYSMLDYLKNPDYISFCQKSSNNSLNSGITDMEYEIHSFSKDNGEECDTTTCSFTKYQPFAGSYVGKKRYHSSFKQISKDFYRTWWFITLMVLSGLIVVFLIFYFTHVKRINLKRKLNKIQQIDKLN